MSSRSRTLATLLEPPIVIFMNPRSLAGRTAAASRRALTSPIASPVLATALALLVGLFAEFTRPHAFDEPVLEGVQWARPGMTHVAWFFNDYLRASGIPALWTMSVLWLLFAKNRPGLAALFVIALLCAPLNEFLKEWFDRPRPAGDFIIRERPEDMSFPSAHTMMAMTFFGLWALVATEVHPRFAHWPIRLAALAAVGLTAYSRVWVAAHWPTDVIAGALFGAAFVGLIWAARHDVDRVLDFAHRHLHAFDVKLLGHETGHDPRRLHGYEYQAAIL
jgi:membrane-associated phospholipid phosphatase